MEWYEGIKNWLLTTLGHAVTGAGTAAIFELTKLASSGAYNLNGLLLGVTIGGSIGLFKSIVGSLEALQKEKGFAAAQPKKSYFY